MTEVYTEDKMSAMRKLTPFLLILAASPLFAATSLQTLGARSQHHQLRVERSASAERVAYNVSVEDLDSGAVLMNTHADGKPGEPVDVASQLGTKQVRVRLAYTPHFFSATLNVIDGKKIVDELRTWWQLEERDASEASAPAEPAQLINAPGAYRVGGDVKAPIVIQRVNPLYPESARQDRIAGIVILEVLIGKDGKVKDAVVRKGLPDGLSEAAVDAVRQWEFQPATLNGEPVDVIFDLTINFRL
jgi:TonB family protein